MFGPRCAGKGIAVGPLCNNNNKETAMGQASSGVERDSSVRHQPSVTIVREDSIQIEEERSSPLRPAQSAGGMMTSTSLLGLPRANASAHLAFFLSTTGPTPPHRRPSKAEPPGSGVATPTKKALHFLKLRPRRSKKTFVRLEDSLEFRDEGGLLLEGVEQRQTSSGQKYLHVVPKLVEETEKEKKAEAPGRLEEEKEKEKEKENAAPALSPDILDSNVSVSIEDDFRSSLAFDDNWFSTIGPPPPRSPLRLGRGARTIEGIIATHNSAHSRKPTPKLAPTIEPVAEYSAEYSEAVAAMQPTVITDCTGPIKRPRSRGKTSIGHPAYPSSRKEREERIRSRKLRDRPYTSRTIDTVVNATPPPSLTRRLRKARPQIQIPELKPAPLVTRASSSASSIASWKKITECTRTPVSPVPSQDSPASNGEKTGYTPISPTASNGNTSAKARMALSPVMLVAEEIPVPKTKSTPKPARLVLKDGKSYAPRPRSASIPHNALKRRSRTGSNTPAMQQTPPRSVSPLDQTSKEDSPPLPSPPPNRALPPTPPASGSERPAKIRATEAKKNLPIPPVYEILPKATTPPKRTDPLPHVVTQTQGKSVSSKDSSSKTTSKTDARLEALEKQNAMLSAALVAVLRTNGAINGPLSALATEPESPVRAMAWESRVARRSAASQGASHAASSSNGSALEMYMSTRRGSKHGCGGA
ncbi:hypothetical protein B0A55_05618 [Friedmanniomyces simplex]|uniref:Uncharacterized protein n=1 Tax=Friedmanniomyces simplex TaxID=329884 RepID=A0A4U0XCN8_9PEZI|nr:hypothetical protein B0A55_05618 [Friedmanniomyces simplex]